MIDEQGVDTPASPGASADEGFTERVGEALAQKSVRRFSAVEFLVVLMLWILGSSFILDIPGGEAIEVVLTTVLLVSGVVAVGSRRRALVVTTIIGTPTLICKWINHFRPDLMPHEVHIIGAMVFLAIVVWNFVRFIVRAPRVNAQVLCAAISVYLMLAMLWSFAFMLVAECVPHSFAFTMASDPHRKMAGFEAIYFSLSTMGGFEYGDIIPISNAARMLASLEAMVSLFYMAVMISRLVSMYSNDPESEGGAA